MEYQRVRLLLLFAIAMTAMNGCTPTNAAADKGNAVDGSNKSTTTETARVDKVVVYYFHNTRRCPTCLGIQRGIEETIDTAFAKDIEAGMLEFQELNMEEEVNRKYVNQFELTFSTMIVSAQAKGETRKWENAGKVWDFAQSPDELKAYVTKMIRKQLDLIGRNV